ncbi:bifunctional DNA primase/polymerase [Actinokineospora soli]|uniref:Bifunctional DNA primase/polymerase n=1 Tax=Actinokineospora soli TaxID=1048753 RepID=A0ABW2TGY5_9PSEU
MAGVPDGARRQGPAVKNWEQRATTDVDRIRRCWSAGPYNVGIATGPAGLVVVDLDTAKPDDDPRPPRWDLPGIGEGLDVLAVLADRHGQPVPLDTHMVGTPSGGLHLYFTAPPRVRLRCTAGERGNGLGWKVDTRAWGGCVAAPGSLVDGSPYTVHPRPVAPLPAWLATLLTPKPLPAAPAAPIPLRHGTDRRARYLRNAIAAEVARVEGATKGQRNQALYTAAVALGQLVAGVRSPRPTSAPPSCGPQPPTSPLARTARTPPTARSPAACARVPAVPGRWPREHPRRLRPDPGVVAVLRDRWLGVGVGVGGDAGGGAGRAEPVLPGGVGPALAGGTAP